MDKKAFSLINIIRNIVSIYFDTFFAIYFFNLTNYEVLPLAKYYLVVYFFLFLSFWLLRYNQTIKHKVYYYRIGISLMALYLALIMLLKENIVHHLYLVAILKGLSEGFYYYPRNILNSSKITNAERQKYDGVINAINQISAIVIPLLLGVLLTFYTYVQIGKVIFILMIVIFVLSYYVRDDANNNNRIKPLLFYQKIIKNKIVKKALIIQFFRGFTITGGVLTAVMMIYKILYFESNLYIGILNAVLGLITFAACLIYAKTNITKFFKKTNIITLILLVISLFWLAINPTNSLFIIYLVVYAIGITFINLYCDKLTTDVSNLDFISEHKAEYHLILETALGISRISGYVVLLIVGLIGNIELLKYLLLASIIPLSLLIIETNKSFNVKTLLKKEGF